MLPSFSPFIVQAIFTRTEIISNDVFDINLRVLISIGDDRFKQNLTKKAKRQEKNKSSWKCIIH